MITKDDGEISFIVVRGRVMLMATQGFKTVLMALTPEELDELGKMVKIMQDVTEGGSPNGA